MTLTAATRTKLFQSVDSMSEAALDELPHGAIQLDTEGRILKYNAYESQLASLDKAKVMGRNFFKEVAPCTDVKEFYGRFKDGVEAKSLHAKFRYHFAFKKTPRDMIVSLFYSDVTNTVWVFVKPLENGESAEVE